MRLSLQLIGFCVTDGILPFDIGHFASTAGEEAIDIGLQLTANTSIKHIMVTSYFLVVF